MTVFALHDQDFHHNDGTHALDGCTLVHEGGVLGLLGPNGAGKSTLLDLLATVRPPSEGELTVLDERLTPSGTGPQLRALRRQIGHLPQTTPVLPRFTAAEQVAYACWLRDVPDDRARSMALDALAAVDLTALANRRVDRLSGGQQRRVGIAMAIAHEPRLLLLDEPTTGLDPEQRVSLRRLLASLARERDSAIVLSTHHTDDVAAVCDQVAILAAGSIRQHGPLETLAARGDGKDDRAATPLERGYLNVLDTK